MASVASAALSRSLCSSLRTAASVSALIRLSSSDSSAISRTAPVGLTQVSNRPRASPPRASDSRFAGPTTAAAAQPERIHASATRSRAPITTMAAVSSSCPSRGTDETSR